MILIYSMFTYYFLILFTNHVFFVRSIIPKQNKLLLSAYESHVLVTSSPLLSRHSPLINLVYPSKFCIKIVSELFQCVVGQESSQEQAKTELNFGFFTRCVTGKMKVGNRKVLDFETLNVYVLPDVYLCLFGF